MSDLIPIERIESRIIMIRDQRVLLDRDLAELYDVKTIALRQQLKRNIEKFPDDFMFQLTEIEADFLVSQNVIPSKQSLGGSLPYVFTQEGVAMLSGVLRSSRATTVNIAIMRTFVQMRKMIRNNELTQARLDDLEDRIGSQEFQALAMMDQIGTIKKKLIPAKSNKPKIGFHAPE